MAKKFDTNLADAQATVVEPCKPDHFDFDAYMDYAQALQERCARFWQADSGVLVYRRMRVAEVFAYDSRDIEKSLQWQLGALKKSMTYQADIANFLEPWYGIGTIASAYGIEYHWITGQAPIVKPTFQSVEEALKYDVIPVEKTGIGRHTLEMIEYFLDKTQAKLPISLTDTQSPLNCAGNVVDISNFMLETVTQPDNVKQLLNYIADLAIEFTHKQLELLASNTVWPGHGFASSQVFKGIGMSDDNMLMLSGPSYFELAVPSLEKYAKPFAGPAFHSCGNWSDRIAWVKQIKALRMVDGAFSEETDPEPNPTKPFREFTNNNIVLNARLVGDAETVIQKVEQLWQPDMKLIVVTYCNTPEEQAKVYNRIHQICD